MHVLRLAALVAIAPLLTGCIFKPSAKPDSAVTFRGAAVDIPVLANDTDPRDRELAIVSATASAHGQTKVNPDNTIKYIPNGDAIGEDVFSYRIKNSRGRTSSTEVTITILEPQTPPSRAVPAVTEVPKPESAKPEITPVAPVVGAESHRAKPMATTDAPPPAVPAPVNPKPQPLVPSSAATLGGVSLTIFTREDDKNAGETVQVTIRRGEAVISQKTIGGSEAWGKQTDLTEEIEITPPVAGGEVPQLSMEVRKVPGLGAGESWVMQVDAQGRLSDGRTVMLVPRSLPFRYGGGSSNSRTWKFAAIPAAK